MPSLKQKRHILWLIQSKVLSFDESLEMAAAFLTDPHSTLDAAFSVVGRREKAWTAADRGRWEHTKAMVLETREEKPPINQNQEDVSADQVAEAA